MHGAAKHLSMFRVVFVALFCVSLPVLAAGQGYTKLNAAEIKSAFYGVTLFGETARSGVPWRECIAENGDTQYAFEGQQKAGKLNITDDSRACFIYDSGPSCFDVFKNDDTYLLTGTADFKVNRIEPGIAACAGTSSTS